MGVTGIGGHLSHGAFFGRFRCSGPQRNGTLALVVTSSPEDRTTNTCPACQSAKTVLTLTRYGVDYYYCLMCEHTWQVPRSANEA
jgi:hypothetical protein